MLLGWRALFVRLYKYSAISLGCSVKQSNETFIQVVFACIRPPSTRTACPTALAVVVSTGGPFYATKSSSRGSVGAFVVGSVGLVVGPAVRQVHSIGELPEVIIPPFFSPFLLASVGDSTQLSKQDAATS